MTLKMVYKHFGIFFGAELYVFAKDEVSKHAERYHISIHFSQRLILLHTLKLKNSCFNNNIPGEFKHPIKVFLFLKNNCFSKDLIADFFNNLYYMHYSLFCIIKLQSFSIILLILLLEIICL